MVKTNFSDNNSNWLDKINFLENKLQKEKEISRNRRKNFENFIQSGFQKFLGGLQEAKNEEDVVSALMKVERVRQEMISFNLVLEDIIARQKADDFQDSIENGNFF